MEPSQLQSAPQQAKLWEMKFTSLKKKKKKFPTKERLESIFDIRQKKMQGTKEESSWCSERPR